MVINPPRDPSLKRKLSGSTDGMPILVVAIATAGTLLHTAVASTTAGEYDEVWLFMTNNHTVAVTVTIEFGDASAEHNLTFTLASKAGLQLVVAGQPLQNGKTVKAFASVASVISAWGFVDYYKD